MAQNMVKQGAEARVYEGEFFSRAIIVKERFSKKYRHPILDEKLTKKRTTQEVRAIMRCKKAGIATPAVYFVNYETNQIFMENIKDSLTVKDYIQRLQTEEDGEEHLKRLSDKIGNILATMHDIDVIHGDLTTSNILIKRPFEDLHLVLIDFGLSHVSKLLEDKGVDLYVLERALLSTHPNTEIFFERILQNYSQKSKKSKEVLVKLEEVRMRGRKRLMVG
ncbi:EKC/KEOPS complex subunit TP53RK-like [Anneissia japonica]|uniref:EKC/KEOPS complex subunit TP53RK-like n=1 Tax=Anneissia japonica TaxID=1529436 RepID=UPI001425A377|nr:EKC/KEOPS complex subunit TP53RK-like [Anneissia japonica]